MTDRLTRIGEKAHGTVSHDDVCWMLDEIERLRNLKGVLMELGNRLVTEHGWDVPVAEAPQHFVQPFTTGVVAALTVQINKRPEMQLALRSMGIDWPMVTEVK